MVSRFICLIVVLCLQNYFYLGGNMTFKNAEIKEGFNLLEWFKKEKSETIILFRSIPSMSVALFVISVVAMNLLANKTIVQNDYLALDGGIVVSWLSFMSMDMIVKRFGQKAANEVAVFGSLCNLLCCLLFYVVSIIPSSADDYSAFNAIFGGTWFILLGSTIAFLASSFINNFINQFIGSLFKKDPDGKLAFAARSYISTFLGQFADNFIFAVTVFMIFAPHFWDGFHWTLLQCFSCALTGAILEMLMEVLFSPLGYKITQRWQKDGVGKEYLEYVKEHR